MEGDESAEMFSVLNSDFGQNNFRKTYLAVCQQSFSVMPKAVILVELCVTSVFFLTKAANILWIHHKNARKMLFVRLTLQTTFSLCQFEGDTETEYMLTSLLKLWRARLYNLHCFLVSSRCWHNCRRVTPPLKRAAPWNGLHASRTTSAAG